MPEAAMHKNSTVSRPENDIRIPGKINSMSPKPVARAMQKPADNLFRFGISGADAAHKSTSLFSSYYVHLTRHLPPALAQNTCPKHPGNNFLTVHLMARVSIAGARQYAGNRGYEDDPRRIYRFDSSVANHLQISQGDLVFIRGRDSVIGMAIIEVRCAIYTRKSTEEGLEQDFNSLDAQREACEAFVASQKHEGWVTWPTQYDDGGYSGGTLDRPALQRLLADIRGSKLDVVVVYKIGHCGASPPPRI
jgi:hypothetical protein